LNGPQNSATEKSPEQEKFLAGTGTNRRMMLKPHCQAFKIPAAATRKIPLLMVDSMKTVQPRQSDIAARRRISSR